MATAFDELRTIVGVDGIQLTPGNHPTLRFSDHITSTPTRRHHGFDLRLRRRDVWSADGRCLVDAESVHPPEATSAAAREITASGGVTRWLQRWTREAQRPLLETMYPGYLLGSGDEIEVAMDLGVPLAVDVSHVFMQLRQRAMSEATWWKLADYALVQEVHVSANDGARDAHAPLMDQSFGLDWVRQRLQAGVPVVLECYMHRLSASARAHQVKLVLGERAAA
jgi:hypothetical protein